MADQKQTAIPAKPQATKQKLSGDDRRARMAFTLLRAHLTMLRAEFSAAGKPVTPATVNRLAGQVKTFGKLADALAPNS